MKKQMKRTKELLCLHKALKTRGRHTKALGNTQRPLAKPSAPDNYLNKSKKVHVSLDIWPSMYHFTHSALTNWYISLAKCSYISSIWCAAFPGWSECWVRPKACTALGAFIFAFTHVFWACTWEPWCLTCGCYQTAQFIYLANGMKCSINKLQMEVIISGRLINVSTPAWVIPELNPNVCITAVTW